MLTTLVRFAARNTSLTELPVYLALARMASPQQNTLWGCLELITTFLELNVQEHPQNDLNDVQVASIFPPLNSCSQPLHYTLENQPF